MVGRTKGTSFTPPESDLGNIDPFTLLTDNESVLWILYHHYVSDKSGIPAIVCLQPAKIVKRFMTFDNLVRFLRDFEICPKLVDAVDLSEIVQYVTYIENSNHSSSVNSKPAPATDISIIPRISFNAFTQLLFIIALEFVKTDLKTMRGSVSLSLGNHSSQVVNVNTLIKKMHLSSGRKKVANSEDPKFVPSFIFLDL